MNHSLRRTGRTTRMLREALGKALEGRTVIVMGWRDYDSQCLMRHLWDMPELGRVPHSLHFTRREIRVGLRGTILFKSASLSPDFHWEPEPRLAGFGPETPIFIDHHTHEMKWEDDAAKARKEREDRRAKK